MHARRDPQDLLRSGRDRQPLARRAAEPRHRSPRSASSSARSSSATAAGSSTARRGSARGRPRPGGSCTRRSSRSSSGSTALEQRLRARPDVVAGTVRVATVYSVGLHTLPPVMKQCLRRSSRGERAALDTGAPTRSTTACLDGDVDFGIVALPARRPQLEIVPLGHDELVIVAPPGHPLARRAALLPRRARRSALHRASSATFPRASWSTGCCAATASRVTLRDGARQHRDDQALGRSRARRLDPAGARAGQRDPRADAGGAAARRRPASAGPSASSTAARASCRPRRAPS